MDAFAKSLLLVMIVLASGCVQSGISAKEGSGLSVRLEASSDRVFQGSETTLYVNVQNNMAQDATNVVAEIFNKGMFEEVASQCTKSSLGTIRQGELQIATCKLKAKIDSMLEDESESTVWAKVNFNSRLQASQVVKLISKNEFEIRQKSGTLEKEPGAFAYRDDNIELAVEFSSEMPIVKKGTREFVTFKIKNIGNGFVQKLALGKDFRFVQNPDAGSSKKLVDESCFYMSSTPPLTPLTIGVLGNEFPAITCEMNLPIVSYVSNLILIINIDYQYEVRESLPVKIIR